MRVFRNLLLVIFFALSIPHLSFACGGCRDSYLGSQKAEQGKESYEAQEQEIFTSIEELNALLDNEIIKAQESALRENEILLNLEKTKISMKKIKTFISSNKMKFKALLIMLKL